MVSRRLALNALVAQSVLVKLMPGTFAVMEMIEAVTAQRWLRCGRIEIWPSRRRVRVGEREVVLTAGEMAILMALVRAEGEPIRREDLDAECRRRPKNEARRRLVDTMICALRRKLGDDAKHPSIIVTIPSFGYAIELC